MNREERKRVTDKWERMILEREYAEAARPYDDRAEKAAKEPDPLAEQISDEDIPF
jgi:hypothetical protein